MPRRRAFLDGKVPEDPKPKVPLKPPPAPPEPPKPPEAELLTDDRFRGLVDLSITRLDDILRLDLSKITDEKVQAKMMAEQRQAAASLVAVGARVDETRFRSQASDRIGQILAEVKAEAALRGYRPPTAGRDVTYQDLI